MLRRAYTNIRDTSHKAYFFSPLYRLTLMGKTPAHLKLTPSDTWTGDPERGFSFLKGFVTGNDERIRLENLWDEPFNNPTVSDFFHSFEWIKDLRSLSDHYTRRVVRNLLKQWVEKKFSWTTSSWAYVITARRISNWLGSYDFFCASADDKFRSLFFKSLARQYRHLKANWLRIDPIDRIAVIKAMLMVQICITGYQHQKTIQRLVQQLRECICQILLDDGGIQSGDPLLLFNLLKDFVDIRNLLRQKQIEIHETLHQAIEKVAMTIRFLRNGAGELSTFGYLPNKYIIKRFFPTSALIDQALSFTESRNRPPISLRSTGYERLQEKGSFVILDTRIREDKNLSSLTNPLQRPGLSLFRFEWSWVKHKIIELADVSIQAVDEAHLFSHEYYRHFTRIFRDNNLSQITCQFRDPQLKMPFCYDRVIQVASEGALLIGQETIMATHPSIACFRFIFNPQVMCEKFKGTFKIQHPHLNDLYFVIQGHDEAVVYPSNNEGKGRDYKTLLFFVDLEKYQPRLLHWKLMAN